MDPQIQTHVLNLADVMVRNTAGSIRDRVTAVQARKKDKETILELEDIISDLQTDKGDLVRIAQAFEDELVAQRISESEIEYITSNLVPVFQRLIETAAESGGKSAASPQEVIDIVQSLLSVETVNILQLIGFNFRQAIGEPLTQVVSRLILSKAPVDPGIAPELQRLTLTRENGYLAVAQSPEAYTRLMKMFGRSDIAPQNSDS